MFYSDDECKSIGGFPENRCYNSQQDFKEFQKDYGSAIDSGFKSGELINVARNEEEKKKSETFLKNTLVPLFKKYTRNLDCV